MTVFSSLLLLSVMGCQKECELAELAGPGTFLVKRSITQLREGLTDTVVSSFEYKYDGKIESIGIVAGEVDTSVCRLIYSPRDTAVVYAVYHCDYKYLENLYIFDANISETGRRWIGIGVYEDKYVRYFDVGFSKDSLGYASDGSIEKFRVSNQIRCVL